MKIHNHRLILDYFSFCVSNTLEYHRHLSRIDRLTTSFTSSTLLCPILEAHSPSLTPYRVLQDHNHVHHPKKVTSQNAVERRQIVGPGPLGLAALSTTNLRALLRLPRNPPLPEAARRPGSKGTTSPKSALRFSRPSYLVSRLFHQLLPRDD